MKPLDQLTHYEVLELDPDASPEDVERSFERLRQVFAPGSLATYTLVDSFDQQRMLSRVEEAYLVLSDAAARAAYDARNDIRAPPRAIAEAPPPPPAAAAEPAAPAPVAARPAEPLAPPPPLPRIAPDTEFDGELLRRVREARGLTIRQVADITRIGPGYLEAIEREDFAKLPERVYLRGFLMSYARELRLDGNRVAASYLARRDAARN